MLAQLHNVGLSARPSWYWSIGHCAANLWGSTRLCTRAHLVYLVYCRFSLRHWTTRPVTAPVCQRHSNIRLLSDVSHPLISCTFRKQNISGCIDTVGDWMSSNRLQLNSDKTELMWLTTARRQQRLPTLGLTIGLTEITPCKAVRDLGVYINADLTMRTHVQRTVSCCFATLRQLRTIRRSVPLPVFQLLVVSLVFSRLDYCNSLLINLPASLIQRLQSIQNAAARLIFNMRRSEHITDALISLYWLCVPERIVFKVATLKFRALHGTAPPYMTSQFTRVADMSNRRRLRSNQLDVPSFRLPTVGSRAFPIAGAKVWNSLSDDVTSAPSLSTFRRHLKTYLFCCCYNTDWYCSYLLWL